MCDSSNSTCLTTSTRPTLKVQKVSDGVSVGIIVGISIGVVAVFLPCLALAIWLLRNKIRSSWSTGVKACSTGVKAIKGERIWPEAPVMPARQWEIPETNVVRGPDGSVLTGYTFQEWQDGGTYQGQVKQGLRDGEGRTVWPNGNTYIGQWSQGTPHGHGLWHAPGRRGWTYNGQFQNGQRHGNGRCESLWLKIWYDGEWRNGLQNGMGENGSVANVSNYVPSGRTAPPFVAHIWWMEQGEEKEHISVSKVAPESWELTDIVLDASPEDSARLDAMNNTDGQLQLVSRFWGVAFGVPESWLSTSWGALTVTQILERGPLWRWKVEAAKEFGSDSFTIHPNAMIWRVNGIMGDIDQMVREICACHGRRRVHLGISNPSHIRFPRQTGFTWGERPGANPFTMLPIYYSLAIPDILVHDPGLGGQTALAIAGLPPKNLPYPPQSAPPTLLMPEAPGMQELPGLLPEESERRQGGIGLPAFPEPDVPRVLNPDPPDLPPSQLQPVIRPEPRTKDHDEPVRGQIDLPDIPKAPVPAAPPTLLMPEAPGMQELPGLLDEVLERSQGVSGLPALPELDVPLVLNPDPPDLPPLQLQPVIRLEPHTKDHDEPVRGQIDLTDIPKAPVPAAPPTLLMPEAPGMQELPGLLDEVLERSQGVIGSPALLEPHVPLVLNPDPPDLPPLQLQPMIRPESHTKDHDETVRGQIDLPDFPKAPVPGVSNTSRVDIELLCLLVR